MRKLKTKQEILLTIKDLQLIISDKEIANDKSKELVKYEKNEEKILLSTFTTTSKKCWKSKLQHTHLKKKQKQSNDFIFTLWQKTQMQPFADVLKCRCSLKFCKIHWKTPVLEFPFQKVAGHAQQLYEKTLVQVYPSEFSEIFKNTILQSISG